MEKSEDRPNLCSVAAWRIELNPGVTYMNLAAFMLHAFATILFLTFFNAMQSFLLTEVYGLAVDELGRVTGTLGVVDEVISILSLYVFGVLSDYIGRRKVVMVGYALLFLSFLVIPFGSRVYPDLLLMRFIYACGSSALSGTLTALLADYVVEKDLGKATGLLGVMSGTGAIVSVFVIVGELPKLLCVANTYFVAAGLAVLFFLITAFGLQKKETFVHHTPESEYKGDLKNLLVVGFTLAHKNKRIALSYVSGFMARGGSILITVYITLWVNKFFITEDICSVLNLTDFENSACNEELVNFNKRTCPDAFSEASRIGGLAQTFALLFAIVFGVLGDRFNPVKVVSVAAVLGVVGYSMVGIVPDPTQSITNIVALLWGVAEIGMIISAQFLVTKNMPKEVRGAVAGCFSLCGAAGIMFITYVGGTLFDIWYEGAPFVLAAIGSMVVLLAAIYVLCTERKDDVLVAKV